MTRSEKFTALAKRLYGELDQITVIGSTVAMGITIAGSPKNTGVVGVLSGGGFSQTGFAISFLVAAFFLYWLPYILEALETSNVVPFFIFTAGTLSPFFLYILGLVWYVHNSVPGSLTPFIPYTIQV